VRRRELHADAETAAHESVQHEEVQPLM